MLVFKARRRVSPALRAENTPSEKRVIQNLVKARREVESWIERNTTSVMDAIAHRPWTTVADMIPSDPWFDFQEYLQDELLAEVVDAGIRATDGPVGKAKTPLLGYRFDATRPEASAWASLVAAERVTEISDGQRLLIRDLISRGQVEGITVDQTARTIRQTVGLTTQQAGWVDNFYNRAFSDGIRAGLSPAQAAARATSRTARYHDQIHRYRAMTIARTEVARAASEGRQLAWNQGIAQGFISPQAQKEWIAEVDACEICAPRNGQRHPVGQPWPDGEPPAHPNCRCDLLLIPEPVSGDFSQLSDAQLMDTIGNLLTGNLVPTVPTAGAQPSLSGPAPASAPSIPGTTAARHPYSRFAQNDYEYFADKVVPLKKADDAAGFMRKAPEDSIMKDILREQGFDGQPTVVDDDTFRLLLDDDSYRYMGRGLADDSNDVLDSYVDAFETGDLFAGRGIFGSGTYMSPTDDVLEYFSTTSAVGEVKAHGRIIDAVLKPDARVIDYDDARRMWQQDPANKIRMQYLNDDDRAYGIVGDIGRWAAANGYDAIRIPNPVIQGQALEGTTYWNVLNRTALVVREGARTV